VRRIIDRARTRNGYLQPPHDRRRRGNRTFSTHDIAELYRLERDQHRHPRGLTKRDQLQAMRRQVVRWDTGVA
jgi:hypothetical protein